MESESDHSSNEGEEGGLLHLENLYKKGKLKRDLAKHVQVDETETHAIKVRARCLTCVSVTKDDTAVFMGDKSGDIIKFDMQSQKFVTLRSDVRSTIYDISCNDTNTLFATAHADSSVAIWDSRTCKMIDRVSGTGKIYSHRGPVYSVCFQKGKESILMSAGKDRSVKMWAADEMVYMRTLYGHRSSVLKVHTLSGQRAVSVSEDRQPRMWKIDVDSTLAYSPAYSCVDDCALLSEHHFVTTSTDGMPPTLPFMPLPRCLAH